MRGRELEGRKEREREVAMRHMHVHNQLLSPICDLV